MSDFSIPPGLINAGLKILPGLIQGKPSNFSAYAEFSAGPIPTPQHYAMGATNCTGINGSVCGTEMNATTAGMASAVANGLWAVIQQYAAQGIRWNNPIFAVVIGQRDPVSIHKPGGDSDYATGIAAPGDVNGAIVGTLNWLKQFQTGTSGMDYSQIGLPPGYTPPGMGAPGSFNTTQQAASTGSAPVSPSLDIAGLFQQYGVWILGGIGAIVLLSVISSSTSED